MGLFGKLSGSKEWFKIGNICNDAENAYKKGVQEEDSGNFDLALKHYDESIEIVSKALKINPEDFQSLSYKARYLISKSALNVIKLNPEEAVHLIDESIIYLNKALEKKPHNKNIKNLQSNASLIKARALLMADKREEAVKILKIHSETSHVSFENQLSGSLNLLAVKIAESPHGSSEKALECINEAILINDENLKSNPNDKLSLEYKENYRRNKEAILKNLMTGKENEINDLIYTITEDNKHHYPTQKKRIDKLVSYGPLAVESIQKVVDDHIEFEFKIFNFSGEYKNFGLICEALGMIGNKESFKCLKDIALLDANVLEYQKYTKPGVIKGLSYFDSDEAKKLIRKIEKPDLIESDLFVASDDLYNKSESERISSEKRALTYYWRENAINWWKEHESLESGACDACGMPLNKGEGYLKSRRMRCEKCTNNLIRDWDKTDNDPDYFGDSELKNALTFSKIRNVTKKYRYESYIGRLFDYNLAKVNGNGYELTDDGILYVDGQFCQIRDCSEHSDNISDLDTASHGSTFNLNFEEFTLLGSIFLDEELTNHVIRCANNIGLERWVNGAIMKISGSLAHGVRHNDNSKRIKINDNVELTEEGMAIFKKHLKINIENNHSDLQLLVKTAINNDSNLKPF